jgi:hypothetical protein
MSCARLSLQRVLFALAGTMTLISVALAAFVSPWLLLLAAFGACPASLALSRVPCLAREAV